MGEHGNEANLLQRIENRLHLPGGPIRLVRYRMKRRDEKFLSSRQVDLGSERIQRHKIGPQQSIEAGLADLDNALARLAHRQQAFRALRAVG